MDRDAIYNTWCDRLADLAHSGSISHDDLDPLPAEVWSVYAQFPSFHKISGSLASGIHDALAYQDCVTYLQKKYNLHPYHLHAIHLSGLQQFLSNMRPSPRATMVKLIYDWAPTYALLHKQNRSESPTCPRCKQHPEDSPHILTCNDMGATTWRDDYLSFFLITMRDHHMPIHILAVLEYKLSSALCLPFSRKYSPLMSLDNHIKNIVLSAIWHQNILGWDFIP